MTSMLDAQGAACLVASLMATAVLAGCSDGPRTEGNFPLVEGKGAPPTSWAVREARPALPCDAQGAPEVGPPLRPAGAFADENETARALANWLNASLGDGVMRASGWTWPFDDGFLQVRATRGLQGHLGGTDALGNDLGSARDSLLRAQDELALPPYLRLDVIVEDGLGGTRIARIQQSVDGHILGDVLWVQTGADGTTIDAPGAFDIPSDAGLFDAEVLRSRVSAFTACAHGPRDSVTVTGPDLVALDRLAWAFTEQTPGECGWTSRSVYFDAVTGAVLESSQVYATC